MADGRRFGIRYLHSVASSPVEDWFSVTDGCIYLAKTIYQDFGAVLPHMPQDGQRMYTEKGHIVISGFRRRLPRFDLRVGRIAQHTFLLPHPDGRQLSGNPPAGNCAAGFCTDLFYFSIEECL